MLTPNCWWEVLQPLHLKDGQCPLILAQAVLTRVELGVVPQVVAALPCPSAVPDLALLEAMAMSPILEPSCLQMALQSGGPPRRQQWRQQPKAVAALLFLQAVPDLALHAASDMTAPSSTWVPDPVALVMLMMLKLASSVVAPTVLALLMKAVHLLSFSQTWSGIA